MNTQHSSVGDKKKIAEWAAPLFALAAMLVAFYIGNRALTNTNLVEVEKKFEEAQKQIFDLRAKLDKLENNYRTTSNNLVLLHQDLNYVYSRARQENSAEDWRAKISQHPVALTNPK